MGDVLNADLRDAGAKAAKSIWQDDPIASQIADPRVSEFADAVIDGLANALANTPGVLQRVMKGASSAAEDLTRAAVARHTPRILRSVKRAIRSTGVTR